MTTKSEIKKLMTWAKKESKQLHRAIEKSITIPMSNIYFSRSEWIDYVLIPKLETILKDQK